MKNSKIPVSFRADLQRAPTLVIDFLIDFLLLIFLALKIASAFYPEIEKAENMFGASVILMLWVSGFYKLIITNTVGPFVVFMKYASDDLKTVSKQEKER